MTAAACIAIVDATTHDYSDYITIISKTIAPGESQTAEKLFVAEPAFFDNANMTYVFRLVFAEYEASESENYCVIEIPVSIVNGNSYIKSTSTR